MDRQRTQLERMSRLDPQDRSLNHRIHAQLERSNCANEERYKIKRVIADELYLSVAGIDEMWTIETLLKSSLMDTAEAHDPRGLDGFRASEMLYYGLILALEEVFDLDPLKDEFSEVETVADIIDFILKEKISS
jgi:hypothetical protein